MVGGHERAETRQTGTEVGQPGEALPGSHVVDCAPLACQTRASWSHTKTQGTHQPLVRNVSSKEIWGHWGPKTRSTSADLACWAQVRGVGASPTVLPAQEITKQRSPTSRREQTGVAPVLPRSADTRGRGAQKAKSVSHCHCAGPCLGRYLTYSELARHFRALSSQFAPIQ